MRAKLSAAAGVAAVLLAPWALAQTVAPARPGDDIPGADHPDLRLGGYSVSIAPDPGTSVMADPGSAAQFGSPSAVDSPSSPMPNPASWPTIHRSDKRPKWIQRAPPAPDPGQPPR